MSRTTRFALIAGFLFVRFVWQVASDFDAFATWETLWRFLLPLILTAAFLPALYAVVLYSIYQSAFVRLDIFASAPAIARLGKRAMLTSFGASYTELRRFAGPWIFRLAKSEDREEVHRTSFRTGEEPWAER